MTSLLRGQEVRRLAPFSGESRTSTGDNCRKRRAVELLEQGGQGWLSNLHFVRGLFYDSCPPLVSFCTLVFVTSPAGLSCAQDSRDRRFRLLDARTFKGVQPFLGAGWW